MTVFLPILVCLCGGVGASCRYLLDVTIKTYWQRAFPLSTFTINLIAGFLAGLVAALALGGTLDEPWRLCLLYTSPSPRDAHESRMPSSA